MSDPTPPERTLKAAELTAEFGLAAATAKRWVKAGCPSTNLGKGPGNGHRFNLEEVRAWVRETGRRLSHGGSNQQDGTAADAPSASGDIREQLLDAKLRKELAMAARWELDVRVRRQELMPRDEAERRWVECCSYARARLMGGPSALAPDLVGEDSESIEQHLTQWVMAALADLAGDGSDG